MKKTMAIVLAVIMLLGIATTALAETAKFTNFKLSNGVDGKQQSPTVEKTTETNYSSKTEITSIKGATASEPMVARVRREDGKRASGSFDVSAKGTYWNTWYSGYGTKGERYYLRMQNTTNGPTITVSGKFTP